MHTGRPRVALNPAASASASNSGIFRQASFVSCGQPVPLLKDVSQLVADDEQTRGVTGPEAAAPEIQMLANGESDRADAGRLFALMPADRGEIRLEQALHADPKSVGSGWPLLAAKPENSGSGNAGARDEVVTPRSFELVK